MKSLEADTIITTQKPRVKNNWYQIRDGNHLARYLYDRHYSRYKYADGRAPAKVIGPGEYILLITPDIKALFAWRKFIDKSGQRGINCAIFRNEGPILSSDLILEAEEWAKKKWPGERFYTYVNQNKIKSVNPGYCFKKAGWRICGETKKRKLLILGKNSTA